MSFQRMSPPWRSSLLFLLALLPHLAWPQRVSHSSCSYKTKTYPHAPKTPIRGDTLTCFCNDGSWIGCVDNEPEVPPFVTALTARSQFSPSDFVFDLKGSPAQSTGKGGTIQPLDVDDFPALAGQGVSLSLFTIEPCGINLPHVHPRATEILYVIKGSRLRTSFVEENDGRTIVNDISEGEVTFFPAGLVHYQQNLGCSPAQYLSALNSEDPGVITISNRVFTLPTESLQATFGLTAKEVAEIKRGIPAGPAMGHQECVKRCGLHWPSDGKNDFGVEWPETKKDEFGRGRSGQEEEDDEMAVDLRNVDLTRRRRARKVQG